MDTVARWSERIARRVTPDEIDFAADVGLAYAAGGKARRDLFARPGTEPGGFGLADAAGELPVILEALAEAGRMLRHALGTQQVGNALALAGVLIALRARAERPGPRDEQPSDEQPSDEQPSDEQPSGEQPRDEQPPDNERAALTDAYTGLRDRLLDAGFPPERAERLARELLEELLADAVSAADFLRRLEDGGR